MRELVVDLKRMPASEKVKNHCSRACGMIFKLRYYVPLSTLKPIYYIMFHSVLLYSSINWGRASKHLLYKINHFLTVFIQAGCALATVLILKNIK